MADLLHCSARTIQRIEGPPHRCPRATLLFILRHQVAGRADLRRRLQAARYPFGLDADEFGRE